MTDPTWQRIKEVFHKASELGPSEREAFLDQACREDEALRAEIESLIASEDSDSLPWLDSPVYKAAPETLTDMPRQSIEIESIGAYKVVRKLGQGGMGAVYLAERADDQYRKRVAIKLVRHDLVVGGVGEEMVRRFRQERQFLADLDHPHIARLLDGDTTDEGLPYFIMEYVDGLPIDVYCHMHSLTLAERIDLFRKVCAAVQHAHGSLVVHCDLKPSNILVTADGEPKLLDFGIARLDDGVKPVTDESTDKNKSRPHTPRYASPEQIAGERFLTTASDIYSLGVLLYKLLTGHLPFDSSSKPVEQAIVEEDPTRPSESEQLQPLESSSGGLRKMLQGDLDSIILMAIRKEPGERYRSVGQFAEDLRRYQDGFPVMARKDTWRYRSGKFVRRHRGGVVAAILVALSLIAGIIATTWLAYVAVSERTKAERERLISDRVSDFLSLLFHGADPSWERWNPHITVKELLDEGARQIETELVDQPQERARVMNIMGMAYMNLAAYDKATYFLEEARAIRRRVVGINDPQYAESLHSLCALWRERDEFEKARLFCDQALALWQQFPEEDVAEDLVETLGESALLLRNQGFYDQSEQRYLEGLALGRQYLGGEHLRCVILEHNLGGLLRLRGRFDEAQPLLMRATDLYRRLLGSGHPFVASGLNTLAALFSDMGDFESAERSYTEALDIWNAMKPDHHYVATLMNNLGALYYKQKSYSKAEPLFHQALDLYQRNLMGDRREVITILNHLGALYRSTGNIPQSELYYRDALSLGRQRFGDQLPSLTISLIGLGRILAEQDRLREAEELLFEALEIREKTYSGGHWRTANAKYHLGTILTSIGRLGEAEPYLLEAYHTLREQRGSNHVYTTATLERIIALYEAWSKPVEVMKYRALRQD